MRSINLIPRHHVALTKWMGALKPHFENVWIGHSATLAQGEGQPPGTLNELGVEADGHLFILDRPTTVCEYEPEEVRAFERLIGRPEQFFAIDYTHERLLHDVLRVLLSFEGKGKLLIEDQDGSVEYLETFLEMDEHSS